MQYEVARVLGEAEDLDAVAADLMRILCQGLGWRSAAIWTKDQGEGRLRCAGVWALPGLDQWRTAAIDSRFDVGDGLPGRVWASASSHWIDDLTTDGNFQRAQVATRAGLRHGVAFPAVVDDRVVAVVECFGSRIRASDEALVAFLAAVGRQVGAFVARVEAQRALAVSEARKTSILEAAVDAIVTADDEGRILDFNPAAERLFGRRRASVVGRPVGEVLVPRELRPAHHAGLDRFLTTGERRIIGKRVRTWTQRPDASIVHVELTVTDLVVDGRPVFTAFIRDITELRQAEVARDRFLEILSHELRTPITSIYGGSKILARPGISHEVSATLRNDIAAEADRLYRMVEDLIVLARAERGAADINLEPLLLDRLVQRLVSSEQDQWPAVDFHVERPPVPGPPVLAEETYVEQVLRNLISNAAKYAATGREVLVRLEFTEQEALVRVLDRGPGLRAEEARRLFEIDYRSSLTEGLAKGSGIGLFVARWLVEVMGGRIWAGPRPGGGSEFGFSLPTLGEEELAPSVGPVELSSPGSRT